MAPSVEKIIEKKVNKGRKRKINISEWKDNKNKRLRNSGKGYTGRTGKIVQEKEPPNQIADCKCNFNCQNFSINDRIKVFNSFYEKDYNNQMQYLANIIEVKEPNSRRVLESVSRRQATVNYYLYLKNKRLRVCQKMFRETFRITARRIQVLVNKIKNNENIADLRGKHTNRPHKTTDSEKDNIRNHIKSFPTLPNHYSRSKNSKECLNSDLSILRMYHLYKDKYPGTQITYHTYREIFTGEFNLRFGVPRSDTCKYCDQLYLKIISATDDNLEAIQKEQELHHRKAEKAYMRLEQDADLSKLSDNTFTFCVDLQQVIFTPHLTHSDIYYQRQYSNYNFAIHDMKSNNATMYFWHESIAKRGATEIASCILVHIKNKFSILQPGQTRKLIIWSDRCVGQNNNWTMISLFMYLIRFRYFSQINQKFLVSGHSFLPCDRDFALIEKRKKISSYYIPEDVVEIIKTAKTTNPFIVHSMKQEEFLDFRAVNEKLKKIPELKITEGRWFQINADNPTVLNMRKTHNIMEPWSSFEILKKPKGRQSENNILKIPQTLLPVYKTPLPIKAQKKKDLMAMVPYLQNQYKSFYINLTEE